MTMSERRTIAVDGHEASYLTAGDGPVVLLLHGTYWSRVWLPVIDPLAAAGLRPVAVDLPGAGRSGGELALETATVPALTSWVARFLQALAPPSLAGVAGHDIGGAIAQRLLVTEGLERLALVNSVTYDSWPVPGVARYRDPAVVAATTVDDILAARRTAVTKALARPATEAELEDYLSPWTELRVARSWMALAGAADSRYTLELLDAPAGRPPPQAPGLGRGRHVPAAAFRPALRGARSRRHGWCRSRSAGHIPMENDADAVAAALAEFFTT